MRYTTRQYAAALYAALKDKSKEKRKPAIRNFIALLRKNRDMARLTAIIRRMEKEYLFATGRKKVEIESAAPLPETVKKEIARSIGGKVELEERVKDEELLGGVKILIDDELLIDASARKRLDMMFAR